MCFDENFDREPCSVLNQLILAFYLHSTISYNFYIMEKRYSEYLRSHGHSHCQHCGCTGNCAGVRKQSIEDYCPYSRKFNVK